MQGDQWLRDYEAAKDLANECLASIQERNLKHPEGGAEASRITAAVRRKLGTLGSLLDSLRNSVELPQYSSLTENERNRRRDLVGALRTRREQMLQALKRDAQQQGRAARGALLGSSSGGGTNISGSGTRETDTTAELSNAGLLQQQTQIMERQDEDLALLERTVVGTKHIALQINEEADLHNRLLEDLDEDVDVTSSRLKAAQRRLKIVMRKAGSCKTQLLIFLLLVILIVVVIIGFKIAIHF
ncbi:hypothetical protein N2152v2_006389 [Parachlorella kessleri]